MDCFAQVRGENFEFFAVLRNRPSRNGHAACLQLIDKLLISQGLMRFFHLNQGAYLYLDLLLTHIRA